MLKPNPNLLADNAAAGYGAPIIFLPMETAETCHINLGTGGNFTLNGTIATSNRGANQDNCCAMLFDAYESLNKTNATQTIGHTKLTMSFSFKYTGYMQDQSRFIFCQGVGSTAGIDTVNVRATKTSITLTTRIGYDECFNATISGINLSDRMHHIVLSIDRTNSLIRCSVNGILKTVTLHTGYSTTYKLPASTTWIGSESNPAGGSAFDLHGALGELYFDTKYIDLATSNPFWDSVENKPTPVRKVMANLGSNPLICMPIDASNPIKNYGTGGDFTANSAPYVGARGASEYIARSAKATATTSYLYKNSLIAGSSKTLSIVFALNHYTTASGTPFDFSSGTQYQFRAYGTSDNMQFYARNEAGTSILNCNLGTVIPDNKFNIVMLCIDLADTAKRFAYVNGTLASTTWTTYINDLIGFGISNQNYIMKAYDGNASYPCDYSLLYFTTDYIDFSQEVNRLKFVDAFNMPTDIGKKIEEGIIPKPLIYLPFDDPTNLGKNLGTGGDFTVNGSITQGADFNI